MIEVETPPCLGCGQTTWFVMTDEQYHAWKGGVHIQNIFPDWPPEDREMLISGTCPSCWEEMWAEEEEEEQCKECGWSVINCACAPFPYTEDFSYGSDYYVDCD